MAIPKLALIPSTVGGSVYSVLPSNGDGDFDFTRASAATRINAQGLIETVAVGDNRLNYPLIDGVVQGCPSLLLEPQRINLVTYSEDFSNGSWTKSQSSAILSNITSPKGTQNVYKFTENTASSKHQLFTTISSYTELTISFFAKKEERSFIAVEKSGWGNTIFDLNIGSVVSGTGDVIDFGNGWFRCASSATRVNKDGLIEIVGSGEPRIDFLNDSNGALLLEPQRTNLNTYSEAFDNAAWTKTSATITSNNAVSPDGTLNADLFNINNPIGEDIVSRVFSFTNGVKTNISIFIKDNDFGNQLILAISSNLATINYDFSTQTILSTSGTWLNSVNITKVFNGFNRIDFTINPTLHN
jgi:hypothetical protein